MYKRQVLRDRILLHLPAVLENREPFHETQYRLWLLRDSDIARFKLVESRDDALVFLQKIGTDVVINATDNSGSRGFYAIGHPDELILFWGKI